MPRPASIDITAPRAWRVLLSPVRMEIVETLRACGAMSIAELGTQLARPADTLYRHVDRLKEGGFVVGVGYRKSGRHVEQIVDVAADDFRLELGDSGDEQEGKAIVDTTRTYARSAERVVRDAAKARELRLGAAARNVVVSYELGWLTPAQVQEVRGHARRIKQIMDDGKRAPGEGARMYMTFVVTSPVARSSPSARRVDARAKSAAKPRRSSTSKPPAERVQRERKRS